MRGDAVAIALLGLLGIAGCGDERLWARWQAERAVLAAQRAADRVLVRPSSATPQAWARAESAFERVSTRWPPHVWQGRGERGREICLLSGHAMLSIATLRRWRGDQEGALEAWRRAAREWAAFPEVALPAAVGEAGALEALGRFDDALVTWQRVGSDFPIVDPYTGHVNGDVLEAPLRAAGELRQRGLDAQADSVLERAYARARVALRPTHPRPELAWTASRYAVALGDFPGAMGALRRLVAPGAGESGVRAGVLALADCALEMEHPDSAITYARWALVLGGRTRGRAHVLAGEAFDALGAPDSALDQYAMVLEMPRDPESMVPLARWLRAEQFERRGRWEQARVEWSALQANSPTHELAFRSLLRIVQHHENRGEAELARHEAESAMNQMRQLLAINADPDVQRQATEVLAGLLERYGEPSQAIRALADRWRRWPADSAAEASALAAARLARRTPGEGARADSLFRALAARARHVGIRAAAARERAH